MVGFIDQGIMTRIKDTAKLESNLSLSLSLSLYIYISLSRAFIFIILVTIRNNEYFIANGKGGK